MESTASDDCEKEVEVQEVEQMVTITTAPEFLTFYHDLKSSHPFFIPHVLDKIFGYLKVKALHQVRLVSKSIIWQNAARTALLQNGWIQKPVNWPSSGPLRPLMKSRQGYIEALERLLSNCPLRTPFLSLRVLNAPDLNFYKERSSILPRVGHLNYGKGGESDLLTFGHIVAELPNLTSVHVSSAECFDGLPKPEDFFAVLQQNLNPGGMEAPDVDTLLNNFFEHLGKLYCKLGELKSLHLDYPLPSGQLRAMVAPTTQIYHVAMTTMEFPDVEWPELKIDLNKILETNPPWARIHTVKLTIRSSAPLDDAITTVRQFLLHLENTAKLRTLELTFQVPHGRNGAVNDTLRAGLGANKMSGTRWRSDDWLLPQGLNQLTSLKLKAVIPTENPDTRLHDGTRYVPPEFLRTLTTALRLPNLRKLSLSIVNEQTHRSCSWTQMIAFAQKLGKPCLSLRELEVIQDGPTNDCPFFPARLWPNLTCLKIRVRTNEFHGIRFLQAIWPQYTGLERLLLEFNVKHSMDFMTDLGDELCGRMWPEVVCRRSESIINLKELRRLTIKGKFPTQYGLRDSFLLSGTVHLKNLQRLTIKQHLLTEKAIAHLKKFLGPSVRCKIPTENQDQNNEASNSV